MYQPGKAAFVAGGQFGSCGKGCAAAWLAYQLAKMGRQYDICTSAAGVQSGHTSIHKGKRRVSYHLPTAPLIFQDEHGEYRGITYLNSGSIINPEELEKELRDTGYKGLLFIHPRAAVITPSCIEAENKRDSAQTKIASTRKGVGEALARKVARSGMIAKDHPYLKQFVNQLDLNVYLRNEETCLVEVPQGVSLSLNHSPFYPNTTSRDCTPIDAMSNAGIYAGYYGATMIVLRTFPIRVGDIVENGETLGRSGDCYPDQKEISWEELGVKPEITTVTKRVRRVFTWSVQQLRDTFSICRPDVVFLTFVNYCRTQKELDQIERDILNVSKELYLPPPRIVYEHGPSTLDVVEDYFVEAAA
jgi:adenylosuccinate synthase